MSLAPDSQQQRMNRVLPELPVELVEDIIDEACRTLKASNVSSIALTSPLFRIHANRARFSSLFPSGFYNPERIETLADVIKSGNAIDTMPGVGAFTTSLCLRIDGWYDEVMPSLDDGCLAYVFDNIFRPCHTPGSAETKTTRSLSLYWCVMEAAEIIPDLSWDKLNPRLERALVNLLRHSRVNRLHLEGMFGVPHNFLQGSAVTHLYLRHVDVSCLNYCTFFNGDDPPLLQLESLDIDGSFSFDDIRSMIVNNRYSKIPVPSGNILPRLTEFSMDIAGIGAFKTLNKVLYNTPALRSLSVTLSRGKAIYAENLDDCIIYYSHLAHLRLMTFLLSLYEGASNLSLVSHLLTHDVPPTLQKLVIRVVCKLRRDDPKAVKTLLEDAEDDIKTLDNHLIHPSFDGIQRLIISLEVDCPRSASIDRHTRLEYSTEWHTYVKSKVPSLVEKKPGLEILVTW